MRHPAKYSAVLMPVLQSMVPYPEFEFVLDPFAGTGRIHDLENETVGVELEPEWANLHPDTHVGDATKLTPWWDELFDAVVTSPTYGNRMADHHDAKDASRRNTYKHVLGRDLSPGSSACMQWGDEYRDLHRAAWAEAWRVLRPGGRMVINIKDHIRKGKQQYVSWWHYRTLVQLGFMPVRYAWVSTPGQRHGENFAARTGGEWVFGFDKPSKPRRDELRSPEFAFDKPMFTEISERLAA